MSDVILCVTHFVMWLVEGREFGIEKIRLQSLLILSVPGHSKAKKWNRETKKNFPSAAKIILPNNSRGKLLKISIFIFHGIETFSNPESQSSCIGGKAH